MEQPPKDQTKFDATISPFNSPAARYRYVEHPEAGLLMVNASTLVVTPMKDQPYPGYPLSLPKELLAVKQKHIRTCGIPEKEGNLGCEAAVGGGCRILEHYGRIGPVNLIVMKDGKEDSCKCHHFYCGISEMGRPTQQVHMQLDGWEMLLDRTTIREKVIDPKTNILTVRHTEVPNLAPMYEEQKVGRYATPPVVAPRRGRKPGSKNKPKVETHADRESLSATGT